MAPRFGSTVTGDTGIENLSPAGTEMRCSVYGQVLQDCVGNNGFDPGQKAPILLVGRARLGFLSIF